jgi:hypothetical protein
LDSKLEILHHPMHQSDDNKKWKTKIAQN